jgi:hypothetical protein
VTLSVYLFFIIEFIVKVRKMTKTIQYLIYVSVLIFILLCGYRSLDLDVGQADFKWWDEESGRILQNGNCKT